MRNNKIKLLEQLIKINSPSGFEDNIVAFIKTELLDYLPKNQLRVDNQKNLIATIPGKQKKTVLIEAHHDTVGFILTNVDRSGFISLQYIGGGDKQILTSRHLNILTPKGIVHAVVNRKHAHLVADEDDEKIDAMYEAQVDIGIRNRKEVLKRVKIGQPVVFQSSFRLLSKTEKQGQFVSGNGFDDKSGCFVLIEAIKEIIKSRKKPEYTLNFVFSAREEIGNPPKKLTKEIDPLLYIGVDVTFASDYGDDNLEKMIGRCQLGNGIVIYEGVNIHSKTTKLLHNIAKKHKIKIQSQASVGNCGYNATEMIHICDRVVILAPPLRSMHSSVETINLKDLAYGSNLLKYFLTSKELKGVYE